ncbi:DNA polymerase Y family protein [Solilutibacter pythonis]|nr:DNA polymerase [Lysobacter pythonis]
MTLRCLFIDFNSYFASVEQEDVPSLRGRPVVVAPVMAATTCCIAASYEAKAYGIKTGTPVWEAMEKCPGIAVVPARPGRYVEMHHRLMDAIAECIPHGKAESIDEVPCWLIGRERRRDNAIAIAKAVKRRIGEEFAAIRCSIGIAPNKFLAKTASDMQKPDGLVVLEQADLPGALHALSLREFCGIGPSMHTRLLAGGIESVEQLCAAPKERLRAIWGGVEGERFWMQLHGFELPERRTVKNSIGHSHVLDPALRNFEAMRSVLFKLLAKVAMKLRREGYVARGMQLHVRFVGLEQRYSRETGFESLSDTSTLLHLLTGLLVPLQTARETGRWQERRHPPLSVAVTLTQIAKAAQESRELLPERHRARQVSEALDRINRKFGHNALFFGTMKTALEHDAAPMRIPFSTIPKPETEDERLHRPRAGDELMHLRERQYKALAESAHRESRKRQQGEVSPRAGAAGWGCRAKPAHETALGQTLPLFPP